MAEALSAYKGTVIFTSHDRHFMKRVATSHRGSARRPRRQLSRQLRGVPVRHQQGNRRREREREAHFSKPPAAAKATKSAKPAAGQRNGRSARKELTNLERTIAQLDEQKRQANDQLLQSTDPDAALRLHNEVTALAAKISEAEERWCELQEELADSE